MTFLGILVLILSTIPVWSPLKSRRCESKMYDMQLQIIQNVLCSVSGQNMIFSNQLNIMLLRLYVQVS